MADSNGGWGEVAQYDDEFAEAWDTYRPIPEPGESPLLDEFVARKHISHSALVRIGARVTDDHVLAVAFVGGIKYRNLLTDARWSMPGSIWHQMKIVQHGPERSDMVIVAEGETDGAWLSDRVICDVAILPAGANPSPHTRAYAAQLAPYERVLLGQDSDRAGNEGAQAFLDVLHNAVRYAVPEGVSDWCEWNPTTMPPVPELVKTSVLVSMREMLELEPPSQASWFENAILPIGGSMIIHGWAKSFKSFVILDVMAALAQGLPWAQFDSMEEPCKVAVMQYEIPWPYFQERIIHINQHATEQELLNENFFAWEPISKPRYRGGNNDEETRILETLLEAGIQVFCLDPIRRAMGSADLNSEKEVRPLLDFYSRLNENGITVITCHHDNKTAGRSGGGDPLGMTGAGAFAGDFDTIVSVAVPKGETVESRDRNIHFTLRNAPVVAPRGFTMTESGVLVYTENSHGPDEEDQIPREGEPAI